MTRQESKELRTEAGELCGEYNAKEAEMSLLKTQLTEHKNKLEMQWNIGSVEKRKRLSPIINDLAMAIFKINQTIE